MSQLELHRAFTQHIMIIIMSCHSHNVGPSCARLHAAVRLFSSACDFDSDLHVGLRFLADSLLDCLSGMRYASDASDVTRIRSEASAHADSLCDLSRTACVSAPSPYDIFGDFPDSALTNISGLGFSPITANSG